ncbi:MAG TPA: hypothetical protein VMR86_18775 [Myxococcota bacterium]|nr:hypothetical protein [Myxococcota bacterium]
MIRRSMPRALVACALLALAVGACKRQQQAEPAPAPATPPVSSPGAFRVTAVDLGNMIDTAKRVTTPTNQFAPNDTIYASVQSDGSASQVAMVARWTYEDGQTVNETTQVIAPSGPTVTEFHIAKASGWPAGKYKVEVTANGALAGSREFEIK